MLFADRPLAAPPRSMAMFCLVALAASYIAAIGAATHLRPRGAWMRSMIADYDKPCHAILYAGLAVVAIVLIESVFGSSRSNRKFVARLFGMLAVISALALLDELTQPYFGRTCDRVDWLADVAGVASVLVAYAAIALPVRGSTTVETA